MSDKFDPVNVLVSGGDGKSRHAVARIIEHSLKEHKFENVHFSRPPGQAVEVETMLDAVEALLPGHFTAGVDIHAYNLDDAIKLDDPTMARIVREAMSGAFMKETLTADYARIISSPMAIEDKSKALSTAYDAAGKAFDAGIKEVFEKKGPAFALEMADSALRAVGVNDAVVTMTLNDGTVVSKF